MTNNQKPHKDSDRPLIEVAELNKKFGQVTALDGISFQVARGEIFGFLGPNGAGKTTTINVLTGLTRPDSGLAAIAGRNVAKNSKYVQRLIGVVPDESNLYPELSGFDNLCFCAALYGIGKVERRKRAASLLERFDLEDAAHRKFAGYSRGMKRKLTIAAAVIHRPRILFLDEPTTGIDVAGARNIRNLIAELNREGTTVFLTTHYIEEAERLCARVAFIVSGRVVRCDSVTRLLQPVQEKKTLLLSVTDAPAGLTAALVEAFPSLDFFDAEPGGLRAESHEKISVGPLARFIEEKGARLIEARRIKPSLEEAFVRVTGLELEAMKKEKGGGPK